MIDVVARMSPEVGLEGLREEVLAKLPRTKYIDGVDLLREVRIALRTKAEKEHDRIEKEELGDNFIAGVMGSLRQQDLADKLNYDHLMNVLERLVSEGKVSKKSGNLPAFQRID